MDSHVRQAFADLEEFLTGSKAPALVGDSLATVVAQSPRAVAAAVVRWAYAHEGMERLGALVGARLKLFDIFYCRVVRFRRVYDFFDEFESGLIDAVPEGDRAYVRQMIEATPWRTLRPIDDAKDPKELAFEGRPHAAVKVESFNAGLYRNATHQILSADKRFTFDNDETAGLIGHYNSKLAAIFDDFVTLIQDPQQKREILFANTADRDAAYKTKSRFEIENYVSYLMEFVVALLNDDFFEHGVQVLGIVRQIHSDFDLDPQKVHWKRFKAQSALIDRQKLAEYSSVKTRAVMLRGVLPLFEGWTAAQLLETVLTEEDRHTRRFALSLLESYGAEIYGPVVDRLAACSSATPWYETRNLAYLLGRIVTSDDALRTRAVVGLAPRLAVGGQRQLNLQVVSALAFIGTSQAASVLAAQLGQFGARFKDREANEVCHKIVASLLAIGSDRALEVALDFCLDHGLVAQYREEFARVVLPRAVRARLAEGIRREARKLRLTRSVMGSASSARTALMALGHAGCEDVEALCRELEAAFPADHDLGAEARRLLATPAPGAPLAADRSLHAALLRRDLPSAFCHVMDAGTSGRLAVETRDGVACSVDLWQGRAVAATVPDYGIADERAFYWVFLLEPRDVASATLTPIRQAPQTTGIRAGMADLVRDAMFQHAEVQRIGEGTISPESRFKRREVHAIYRDFSRLESPRTYEAVWEALAEEVDLKTIRARTRLSRHDIFKVLLYLQRRNMLSADAAQRDTKASTITDALGTVELYLRRIGERPVAFRSYHAAANGCAYLQRHAVDNAMKEAAAALRGYLLDAFDRHRPFGEENLEVAMRAVELMARFHASRKASDRHALTEYVGFTFAEGGAAAGAAKIVSRSVLEQIENIEADNDPYEAAGAAPGAEIGDELASVVGRALSASGVSVEALADGREPTDAEAAVLARVFGNVARLYAKPLRDFARELMRARTTGAPASGAWLPSVLPSIRALAAVAAALSFRKAASILGRLERAADAQMARGSGELAGVFCELVLAECERLAELAPLAFGTSLEPAQLTERKGALLARFVLRQIDDVGERELNRLAGAGFVTFEDFLDAAPDEIARGAGLRRDLTETLFLKFYQYQDFYYHRDRPEGRARYVSMFEIGLNILKELHGEVERIAADEYEGKAIDAGRKQELVAARQRTLASVMTLLCLRERYDMVEALQLAAFEERIRLLDGFYASLASSVTSSAAA